MDLYLHIGTEKTGSSFLQTYFARNRAVLEKNKICFPNAGVFETSLQKGIITPGNANDLEGYLNAQNWSKIECWMLEKVEEAKSKNCNSILLSNEVLILRFAEENILSEFLEILKKLKVNLKGVLLIIREPIGQALSLFKHRSKEGDFIPIEDWLKSDYFIADALRGFYKESIKADVKFQQYVYKKDSEYLIDLAINQWLELNEVISVEPESVNPSLTLSELLFLSEINENDKYSAECFYKFMIELDIKQKSDDMFLKRHIQNHINNFMVGYNDLWIQVGKRMTKDRVNFQYQNVAIDKEMNHITFTPDQIKAISDFINYSRSFSFLRKKTCAKIKLLLSRHTPEFMKIWIKKLLVLWS